MPPSSLTPNPQPRTPAGPPRGAALTPAALRAALLLLPLFHALWAQQAPRPRMTLDRRLAAIEARLAAIEERVAEPPPAAAAVSLDQAKLDRLEARVIRLEESPGRQIGAVVSVRDLEARIRSLERQVARLRRDP